jgi:hypothetical protein
MSGAIPTFPQYAFMAWYSVKAQEQLYLYFIGIYVCIPTYLPTYLTNQLQGAKPFLRNCYSASQEIPRLLWNPKVHYRVHNSPTLVPILSLMHPVHTFPPYFPNIHSNITIPSTPRSSEWSLPFRFSNQDTVRISRLSHACYMPYSNHPL